MKKIAILGLVAAVLCGCVKKDEDTIRMITEATFPPYEFLRGDEVVGIDVEICRAVAEKLGKKFVVESVNFDSVIPTVISGKADLAAAGITITEDRKQNVDFSVPYVKTGIVFVYKTTDPYLTGDAAKGKKVGVQSGTTSETYVIETLGQQPERFDSPAAAVAALKAGRRSGEELREGRGFPGDFRLRYDRRVRGGDPQGTARAPQGHQRDDRGAQGERQARRLDGPVHGRSRQTEGLRECSSL